MKTTLSAVTCDQQEAQAEQHVLRAGPLTLLYEQGELRNVRCGNQRVLLRLYAAVRDSNWATVPAERRLIAQEIHPDSFRIVFDSEHRQGDIHFVWRGTLTGELDGTLTFDFEGEAKTTFARNRIGFCLLHPAECAGVLCKIDHVDGSKSRAPLPEFLSPDQPVRPFAEMRALTLQLNEDLQLRFEMEGDTFEMEDQRNWTDASYKTFCTPLRLPFPVTVPAGTRIRQTVRLFLAHKPTLLSDPVRPITALEAPEDDEVPLPLVGFGCPWQMPTSLSNLQIARLKALQPAHLRVELILTEPEWRQRLREGWGQAQALGVPIEMALLLSPAAENVLHALCATLDEMRPAICRWLILPHDENPKRPPDQSAILTLASRVLAGRLQDAAVAAGTNSDFIFLNQFPPPLALCQSITFAVNPQVHAFDAASLMETLPMQAEVVKSADRLGQGLPVVISPVTLKPRFNPYATTPLPRTTPPADPRQAALFGAAWTLGSLVYLATSGVASITYFETVGKGGLLDEETVFPLYHVFADMAAFKGGHVSRLKSTCPEAVVGLRLRKNGQERVLLANLTPEPQEIALPKRSCNGRMRWLDQRHEKQSTAFPAAYRIETSPLPAPGDRRTLSPYATLCIDIEPLDFTEPAGRIPGARNAG